MKNHRLFLLQLVIALIATAVVLSSLRTPTGQANAPRSMPGAAAP